MRAWRILAREYGRQDEEQLDRRARPTNEVDVGNTVLQLRGHQSKIARFVGRATVVRVVVFVCASGLDHVVPDADERGTCEVDRTRRVDVFFRRIQKIVPCTFVGGAGDPDGPGVTLGGDVSSSDGVAPGGGVPSEGAGVSFSQSTMPRSRSPITPSLSRSSMALVTKVPAPMTMPSSLLLVRSLATESINPKELGRCVGLDLRPRLVHLLQEARS